MSAADVSVERGQRRGSIDGSLGAREPFLVAWANDWRRAWGAQWAAGFAGGGAVVYTTPGQDDSRHFMTSVSYLRRMIFLCAGAVWACHSPEDWSVPGAIDIAATGELPSSDFEEVRAGTGRPVMPGDRVTIHVIGRYADRRAPFSDGPITFIAPSDTRQDVLARAAIGARAGARRRFEQPVTPDSATGSRFSERTGLFQEKEFFRYRNDRGTLTFETEVLEVCRPREFVLFRNSRWQIRNPLGCR
jgi:hypothetical protein